MSILTQFSLMILKLSGTCTLVRHKISAFQVDYPKGKEVKIFTTFYQEKSKILKKTLFFKQGETQIQILHECNFDVKKLSI